MMRHDPGVITFGYPRRSDQHFKWFGLVEDVVRAGPDGEPMRRQIETQGLEFRHVIATPAQLIAAVHGGELMVAVVPASELSRVADRYVGLRVGATIADRFGPQLVGRDGIRVEELSAERIAVADEVGVATRLLAALVMPKAPRLVPVGWRAGIEAVLRGDADAAIVHDEAQVTYLDAGLTAVIDLGEWWKRRRSLPLPLELVLARRDLRADVIGRIEALLLDAQQYAMIHRDEAIEFAAAEAGVTWDVTARLVDMYVNRWCRRLDGVGEAALAALGEETGSAWSPSMLTEPVRAKGGR